MTVIVGPDHKDFFRKNKSKASDYIYWLNKQKPLVAIIAWDIITNKLSLDTVRLADIYGMLGEDYKTFIGVLQGANLDLLLEDSDIRDIALDELDEEINEYDTTST